MSRIVLFGTGAYYRKFKTMCCAEDTVVGLIDNNRALWGQTVDGMVVNAPDKLGELSYDYIILLSAKAYEMKDQLSKMGIPDSEMLYLEEYRALRTEDKLSVFAPSFLSDVKKTEKRRVLFVSTDLDYNGGTIAVLYAALALRSRGYRVALAAPGGNMDFIREVNEKGITVCLSPLLPMPSPAFCEWMTPFDVVFVNVFQMLVTACEIRMQKPTIWWIHECSHNYDGHYERTRRIYKEYDDVSKMEEIHIIAVSEIAKNNFNYFYPDRIGECLAYGIPDEWDKNCSFAPSKSKVVFSVIGSMSVRKNQKVLLHALKQLPKEVADQLEIRFIGDYNTQYGMEVQEEAKGLSQIKFSGVLNRQELAREFCDIDVLVCPSLEETMSITVTEGMMFGKLCLVSKNTGMAQYIAEGGNGYVFDPEDERELAGMMSNIVRKRDEWEAVRKKARETYETEFSMDVFADRLEKLIGKVGS